MPGDRDPHSRARRLRGRPARVRPLQGEGDHQGRARSPQEGRRLRPPPHRRVPRPGRRAARRRDRHGRDLRARPAREDLRNVEGQGLPGHDQAPQLQARPQVARLAQRPRAGIDRRLGHALARVQGHARSRPDGRRAGSPSAGSPSSRCCPSRTCCSSAARFPDREVEPWRSRPMARTAPKLGGGTATLDADGVRGPLQHAARPRDGARRAERAPPGHRVGQDPRRGPRRRREAVAPEGHGPRPRRVIRVRRIWTGGGVAFGPQPRGYTVKVNRKARKAALRSALSVHAERESLAVFDAGVFDAPSTAQAAGLLADWGAGAPTLVLLAESEAPRGQVVSEHRQGRRDAGRRRGRCRRDRRRLAARLRGCDGRSRRPCRRR